MNDLVRVKDLVDNPTARVPVCLCLDVSGSMSGDPIQELQEGVQLFYDAVREDTVARYAVEVCIVTFGGSAPECLSDFTGLANQSQAPSLSAGGMTPMGEAVNMALDLLDRRKQEYKDYGVDYWQPWLVLMTDGAPNGDEGQLLHAIAKTTDLVNDKKLVVFPIGIGEDADMDVLAKFSPKRPPLKLSGLKFREFFQWLSQSVSKTSQSMPGERVPLDTDGIRGWAEL